MKRASSGLNTYGTVMRGGRKSMTEEEARRSAGLIFQETSYRGKEWYRVDQVELDKPLPILGAR